MAAIAPSPAPVDPAVPAVSAVSPMPADSQPIRPRFRRLVVFTGRIS